MSALRLARPPAKATRSRRPSNCLTKALPPCSPRRCSKVRAALTCCRPTCSFSTRRAIRRSRRRRSKASPRCARRADLFAERPATFVLGSAWHGPCNPAYVVAREKNSMKRLVWLAGAVLAAVALAPAAAQESEESEVALLDPRAPGVSADELETFADIFVEIE